MLKSKSVFQHRFGPVLLTAIITCTVSFLTRIILLIKSWPSVDHTISLAGIFLIGLFYDLIVASFFALPVALYCWLMKDNWYKSKWNRIPLYLMFFVLIFFTVLAAGSEIAFWQEFNVRFNFIAVDYIVYTTELFGNAWESYNMPLVLSGLGLFVVLLVFLAHKKLIASQQVTMSFAKRSRFFIAALMIPVGSYFLVNNHFKNISNNNFTNELAGNGLYEFSAAFWNNSIDYDRFYARRDENDNFNRLRKMLQAPNATFINDSLSIDRVIKSNGAEHKWNVVLISVESLSADYLSYFGNKDHITPHLDSLIGKSLFFNNFYASGTRTVRGLEAISLAIPPTPGQSIVRRPDNENMFTIGSVFKSKGYDVRFIYGGNSFFDNMGYFFSHNGYEVQDKSAIPSKLVSHTTVWGVDDEATFNYAISECDESYKAGKPFFNHIMTVSNHRPYTYPEGRIDIPASAHIPQGGVKYTDYAINEFLEDAAKKPWFDSTMFVIVADHCSRSAGKTDLPVTRYHIPCFVFAPKLIKPQLQNTLTSQIDLAPTILGLLNMNYTSRFFGIDVLNSPKANDRIFISTYENLGYIKDDKLVILTPQKKVASYQPDFVTGEGKRIPDSDTLTNEAIAWYEGANYLFRNQKYKHIN